MSKFDLNFLLTLCFFLHNVMPEEQKQKEKKQILNSIIDNTYSIREAFK